MVTVGYLNASFTRPLSEPINNDNQTNRFVLSVCATSNECQLGSTQSVVLTVCHDIICLQINSLVITPNFIKMYWSIRSYVL